jgi:hypothetical protein
MEDDDAYVRIIAIWEEKGEEWVRLTLQSGGFSSGGDRAVEWLAERDQAHRQRDETSTRRMNWVAIATLAVATIGTVAAVVTLFHEPSGPGAAARRDQAPAIRAAAAEQHRVAARPR